MKPNSKFLKLPKNFWASVRLISQQVGYTEKLTKKSAAQIKVPTINQIQSKLEKLGIDLDNLHSQKLQVGNFEETLHGYSAYRADIINTFVESHLMNATEAQR